MTYVVATQLLLLVELRVLLIDTRAVVGGVTTEGDVQVLQESVAASEERLGGVGMGIDTRLAVKDNDAVSQVGGHDEIVLDDKGSLLVVHDEALDDARGNNTLLGVEVGRGLINQVDVGGETQREDNGNTLQFTTGQVLDLLVDEVVELEGLDDVGLELRRQESLLNLLEEELADGAVKLGGDGLGLHANSHLGDTGLAVGLQGTSEETAESGLSSTVLSHHDNDFGIREFTGVDAETEVAESLLELGVLEGARAVKGVVISTLNDAEGQRLVTESQVLGGDVAIEEDVDTFTDGRGKSDNTVDGGTTVENADVIREVVKDGQIVLDNNDVVVIAEKRADNPGSAETLLDIKVRGRLVKHVDVGLLDTDGTDSETLQLTTRQVGDVTIHDVVELENLGHLLHIVEGGTALNEGADTLLRATDGLGDLVDILGFNDGLEVIFQQLGEVVYVYKSAYAQGVVLSEQDPRTLQFRTTEVLDDIFPVGGVIVATQVRLELSGENLQGGTLANTVGSDKTEDLVGARHRQAMKLEAVGAIAVGDLALEVGGQVDDGDGVEGAFLGADTTTNAERLGDEGQAGLGGDFNAELSTADDGARLFAFLSTFARAALWEERDAVSMAG